MAWRPVSTKLSPKLIAHFEQYFFKFFILFKNLNLKFVFNFLSKIIQGVIGCRKCSKYSIGDGLTLFLGQDLNALKPSLPLVAKHGNNRKSWAKSPKLILPYGYSCFTFCIGQQFKKVWWNEYELL